MAGVGLGLGERAHKLRHNLYVEAYRTKERLLARARLVKLHRWIRQSLIYNCFQVSDLDGDYLEFGVFTGSTMIQTYWAARRMAEDLMGGRWKAGIGEDASLDDIASMGRKQWEKMRFIGFDSFEGIPESGDVDRVYHIFGKGSYSAAEEDFRRNIKNHGVDESKIQTVKGFFNESLTEETAKKLKLERISVALIDADLYQSAVDALRFCTPYFRDGSVIIFDEWYHFRGNPRLGEQRAFAEWQDANPDWIVSPYKDEGPYRKAFILSKDPGV